MTKWEEFKQQIVESTVWRSMFRHGYEDTPRNRILAGDLLIGGNRFDKVNGHGMTPRADPVASGRPGVRAAALLAAGETQSLSQ